MISTRVAIAALVTVELALSTSGALAAQRTHHHHASPALLSSKGSGALNAYAAGPGNSNDSAYVKNLRDSGYNPKNNFDNFGNVLAVPYGQ
jgi:hypothetical protein